MDGLLKYMNYSPLFLGMVVLGISVNLIQNKNSLSFKRIIKEIFSSIWIAIVVGASLENFTDWSLLLISGLSSVAGYFNSRIISIIGNDIVLAIGEGISKKIKSFFNSSNEDEIDQDFPVIK